MARLEASATATSGEMDRVVSLPVGKEILMQATNVFGSQEDAEVWLSRSAIGVNQQRPIDLLATTACVKIVEEHLTRLEYGVYT